MRLLLPILGITFLFSTLSAQDTAKGVYDKMTTAQKDMAAGGSARPDPKDKDAMKAWQAERSKKAQEFAASVKDALAANEKLFAEGDGVYYRARMQQMARDPKAATESFKSYIEKSPDTDLSHEARLVVAQMTSRDDNAGARKLLADIKADKLSEPSRKMLDGMQKSLKADETRASLAGNAAPAIAATKVLNGNADWSLASLKGKVVVVDFWATWCPPCRGIIPDLVKLQEKYGAAGLQLVGVTTYYGNGMDFAEGDSLPHGGKTVGREPDKKLSEADEVTVNENFIKVFKVNYPVVFTGKDVPLGSYGVTGIPTCYVIGRDGKIIDHIVGGGDENHAKLEKLITEALGNGAAEASGKKGAGN